MSSNHLNFLNEYKNDKGYQKLVKKIDQNYSSKGPKLWSIMAGISNQTQCFLYNSGNCGNPKHNHIHYCLCCGKAHPLLNTSLADKKTRGSCEKWKEMKKEFDLFHSLSDLSKEDFEKSLIEL